MAIDIKDAGILAGFELWGWPWHGLCDSGVIDLGSGLSKTITAPAHGSAWLIDRALPAIERSPAQLLADAALGHQWRNYGLISGGLVHGTAIGTNSFVHVDTAGVRWLVSLSYSYPDLAAQKVRITFSVVQFGLFGEGIKTPVSSFIDVQCHYITYTIYGYTYTGYETLLEDVWTNGSRCLVSVARTKLTAPSIKDIFSLIEVTLSGAGGADGSGLVIDATEVMQDTQLSQGTVGDFDEISPSEVLGGLVWSGLTAVWSANLVKWDGGMNAALETMGALSNETNQTYARFAYYNAAGEAKAARIQKIKSLRYSITGSSTGGGGTLVGNSTNCDGSPSLFDTIWHDSAVLTANTTVQEVHEFGIKLLENDTVIDSVTLHQEVTGTSYWAAIKTYYPAEVGDPGLVCDERVFPPGSWGTLGGGLYSRSTIDATFGAPAWQGSLATALSLGTPPDVRTGWYTDDLGGDTEPLQVDALVEVWRSAVSNHHVSGSATVAGTSSLGICRIDAKSAAFYMPGTSRTWGNIITPLGVKTSSGTSGDLYFSWQRKTGEFAFSANPICWV